MRLNRYVPIKHGTRTIRDKIFLRGIQPRLAQMITQMKYPTVCQITLAVNTIEAMDASHSWDNKKQKTQSKAVSGGQKGQG